MASVAHPAKAQHRTFADRFDALQRIVVAQQGLCFYCGRRMWHYATDWNTGDGRPPGRGVEATLEHLTPRSRGGGDEDGNLAAACHSCNASKRAKTLEEYRAYKGGIVFPGELR